MVSIIKSALADDKAGWVKRSATIRQLWSVSLKLVSTLDETFLERAAGAGADPMDDTQTLWRARYADARQRLRQAGVPLSTDERTGEELYVELRLQWDPLIAALAPAMAYSMDEIDPVRTRLKEAGGLEPLQN